LPNLDRVSVVLSDSDGNVAIRNLPEGGFSLSVAKAGYLEPGNTGSSASIIIEGEPDPITLRLTPQAVIKGKIIDEAGHGLWGYVTLALDPALPKASTFTGTSYLDHTGEFRFFNLPEGRYYVSVYGLPDASWKQVYPPAFYPGATTLRDATPIDVMSGQEKEIEFRRQVAAGFTVRGVANCPSIPTQLGMSSDGLHVIPTGSKWDRGTGAFTYTGIPVGVYQLAERCTIDGQPVEAAATFTVADADVDGVILQPVKR
jgi:hypothetical protein